MINLKNKKTQRILAAALAGCALMFVMFQFLALPALAAWKEASAATREIRQKVEEMRRVVQAGPDTKTQIEAAREALKTMAKDIPLPVLGNYLLGMESHARGCASNIGINITGIADNGILEITPGTGKFRVYRVRAQSRSGFHDFIRFVESIHKSNPLVSISGINIAACGETPAVHDISFVIAWLVWAEPAKRPACLLEVSGANGKHKLETGN